MVTFGITPDSPQTGYGYLELAAAPSGLSPVPLTRSVEKPCAARAAQMLAAGNYLWNAGIFLFAARDMIAAFPGRQDEVQQGEKQAGCHRRGAAGFLLPRP